MSAYLGDKLVSLTAHIDYNTNDATAGVEDVLRGEVFYNAEGRQVGTHVCPTVDELLPELSNPATAEQILSGYEAINGEGVSMTGNHTCKTLTELLPTLSNPAGAGQILKGYNAVNNTGSVVTGTLEEGYKIYSGSKTTSSGSTSFTIDGFDFTPEGFAIAYGDKLSASTVDKILGYHTGMGNKAYATQAYSNSVGIQELSNISASMSKGNCKLSRSGSTKHFAAGLWWFIVWGK